MATPKPMCAVTIGFETYLMPADAGMKVVQLMTQAVTVEREFGAALRDTYSVGDTPRVEYVAVKQSQIKMPEGAETIPARPSRKQISQQSLRLTQKGD